MLGQQQANGQIHPIVFASRSLTAPKGNYTITELETDCVGFEDIQRLFVGIPLYYLHRPCSLYLLAHQSTPIIQAS